MYIQEYCISSCYFSRLEKWMIAFALVIYYTLLVFYFSYYVKIIPEIIGK